MKSGVAGDSLLPQPPIPSFYNHKIGLSHTGTLGLSHTDPYGVSHTDFEVVEESLQR